MERGHGVAHEVHQNGPKWTKMVTISWQSKSVSNLSWVTYMIFFWIKWTLERGWSQYKSWRGHGVTHEVYQNAPKLTKEDQNCHPHVSPFKCPFNHKKDHISHSGQIWYLCSVMIWWPFCSILVKFHAFLCILVHLIWDAMTPPWLALTFSPF